MQDITESSQWPPKPYDTAFEKMAEWSAWYDGDTEALAETYTDGNQLRPSQFAGGLVGQVSRFFWGRPNVQKSNRVHVPTAADLARASSDLLFAEPPKFEFPSPEGDGEKPEWMDEAQDRLDLIFNNDHGASALSESGEVGSAYGGVFYRLWWSRGIADHVLWSPHAPDAAIPEFEYDRLVAVTFWHTLDNGKEGNTGKVIRHLERHEPGKITHSLYQGNSTKLGTQMPLDSREETAWVSEAVGDDGVIETGIDRMTAVYSPNVKPNRGWRKIPGLSQLGRSDYEGLEPLFDALDEAWSSMMRDVDLGKARLIVGEDMLDDLGPGRGGRWDSEREIFTPVAAGYGSAADGASGIDQVQFDIRHDAHSKVIAEILNAILTGAGISAAQFSDSTLTLGAQTATEVNSRNSMSERTRSKKIAYVRSALVDLAEAALLLDAQVFGTGVVFDDKPTVSFPVRSMQNPESQAGVLGQLKGGHLVSTQQAVEQLHPNWTPEQVEEEITRINEDMLEEARVAYGKAFEEEEAGGEPGAEEPFGEEMDEGLPEVVVPEGERDFGDDSTDPRITEMARRMTGDIDGDGM